MFSEENKYSSKACGEFSTFGWCSEREMAYTCLLSIKNYVAKVKAEHGHSWTELIIPLRLQNQKKALFKISVDNTFDKITFVPISKQEFEDWKLEMGDSKTKKWYNKKAKAESDVFKLKNTLYTKTAFSKLEKQVVKYLKSTI